MNKVTKINTPKDITEARFWELVELAKWPCDCEKMSMRYRAMLSKEECKAFRKCTVVAYGMLDKVANYKIYGVGYDSDLLYHIIGMGKKAFYQHINNLHLIQKRASSDSYEESFCYCIPDEDDYKKNGKYTLESIKQIAKYAMKEVDLYHKLDNKELKWLTPIQKEIDDIEMLIQNFLDNPTNEGLEEVAGAKWVEKATKKISKFFEKNYLELPRKFTNQRTDGSCFHGMCTAIFDNMVSDANDVLEFLALVKIYKKAS